MLRFVSGASDRLLGCGLRSKCDSAPAHGVRCLLNAEWLCERSWQLLLGGDASALAPLAFTGEILIGEWRDCREFTRAVRLAGEGDCLSGEASILTRFSWLLSSASASEEALTTCPGAAAASK